MKSPFGLPAAKMLVALAAAFLATAVSGPSPAGRAVMRSAPSAPRLRTPAAVSEVADAPSMVGGERHPPIDPLDAARAVLPTEPPSAVPRAASPELCVPDDETLCLQGGRFRVRARFRRPSGELSAARARPLTNDTGTFWFFDPDNIELLVKVLDGCAVNRKYWVFAAGLTDREVGIEVTDGANGLVSGYSRPGGRAFRPIQDLFAFGTCP